MLNPNKVTDPSKMTVVELHSCKKCGLFTIYEECAGLCKTGEDRFNSIAGVYKKFAPNVRVTLVEDNEEVEL